MYWCRTCKHEHEWTSGIGKKHRNRRVPDRFIIQAMEEKGGIVNREEIIEYYQENRPKTLNDLKGEPK